jgi:hypothetical protein
MKIAFVFATALVASPGVSQDIRNLSTGFYFATGDAHGLPKLGTLTQQQKLVYSGQLVVSSGLNSTYYEFSHGKRMVFVTEDKVYEDPTSTFTEFLKHNVGKDIRVGFPVTSRLVLPADAQKLVNFSGTLAKQEMSCIQIFTLNKGKIIGAQIINPKVNPAGHITPDKKR